MSPDTDRYESFVDHPLYGKRPHITGLNPETKFGGSVFLHWHSPKECRIPNTAIRANVWRQVPATVAVTHYFDVVRKCQDCGKSFIFFAKEQKHWYEELGFKLVSDCVRCFYCRKKQRGIDRSRERYEELFHFDERSMEQNLEMADCCLTLIENAIFHQRQTERVRMLLKQAARNNDGSLDARYHDLLARLRAIESQQAQQ